MWRIVEDVRAVRRNDPAARGTLEILLCYPGLHAQWMHRVAHRLWLWRVPVLPRFLSHLTRFFTGIEIHPGAQLGRRVFIDHGMGVVIGETAEVGDDCLIYQGVTLGGTSLSHGKRHPTLEPHVVVGSGAKVLGNIRLGAHSRVGSGSVVIKSAPPHSTIVGIPGRVLEESAQEGARPGHDLEHHRLPDPDAQAITALREQVQQLAREVASLHRRPRVDVLPAGMTAADIEAAFRAMRANLPARNEAGGAGGEPPLQEGAGI
jgi:serine O-acetyltransferase